MAKKKSREVVESESDISGSDNEMEDVSTHEDSDHGEDKDDDNESSFDDIDDNDNDDSDGDDVLDDDDDEEHDEENDSEEDGYEGMSGPLDVQNGDEMKELEKEYNELKNKEQDIWRNLKSHKDEDIQKGQAVKHQRALWDRTLEFRFLLQKPFTSSNRLPQEPVRSLFCDADSDVSGAYSNLIDSSKKTLDSILELQKALLANNPLITQEEGNAIRSSKKPKDSGNSDGAIDEEWSQISEMQSRMASFRDKSIDKWQRKTQVTTGAAAMKGKLQAFNQSISEQVAGYMRDPSKMIMGMQQHRSAVAVFGNVIDSADNVKPEEATYGDPELLDDSELYQQLLKEFFETIDPASSESAFYAMKRLQTKKRKIVDQRASKSRKIRYHVHEKIVNFMAPRPMKVDPMAPKLFENLFGLKTQKPAFGA